MKKIFKEPIFIILLLGYFFLMFGNSNFTLFDNSETNYSAVAQEIINTKDPLTMHYNSETWFVHPPLYFWIASATCELFGWNEFNLRFWESIFGILGLIATYSIARLFYPKKTSLYAALITGSSLIYFVIGRLAIFDTMLHTFILFCLYFFLKSYQTRTDFLKYSLLAFLCAGLAVLTKGPIGLIQPGAIIFIFLLFKKDLKFILNKQILPAIIIFLIIAVPWYAHQLILHGKPFFDFALKDYTWYRFFGVVEAQTGPIWFYIPWLLAYFPWIFFLPATFNKTNQTALNIKLFSWITIIFTFIFFSFAGTKLPNYNFLIFPFFSILIAGGLENISKKINLTSAILLTIFTGTLFIYSFFLPLPFPYNQKTHLLNLFFAIPFSYALLFCYNLFTSKSKDIFRHLDTLIFGMLVFVAFLVIFFFPQIEEFKDSKHIVKAIQQTNLKEYHLVTQNLYSPYLMYYLNKKIISLDDNNDIINFIHKSPVPVFIVLSNKNAENLLEFSPKIKLIYKHYTNSVLIGSNYNG